MAKANRADRDPRAQGRSPISEQPDETAGGRPVHEDGMPATDERWSAERFEDMPTDADEPEGTQTQSPRGASPRGASPRGAASSTSMRAKGANQSKH
jgi:hypothetical protein